MLYFNDPLFQFQGYLSGLAPAGSQPLDDRTPDMRLESIWDDYRGSGVTIAVPGLVDRKHPDLKANYDTSYLDILDPLDLIRSNPEAATLGTFFAGLVAADDNGQGLVGVAPDASVVGYLDDAAYAEPDIILTLQSPEDEDRALFDFEVAPFGRDGLGTIVMTSNSFGDSFAGTLQDDFAGGVLNSEIALHAQRHVVSVMPVSAYGQTYAFTMAGDMTLVSAPVFTDASSTNFFSDVSPTLGLDPRGNLGDVGEGTLYGFWESLAEIETGVDIPNDGELYIDISGFGAHAIASGVVAMMLEANPGLGWRDVQEILAYSAKLTGPEFGQTTSGGLLETNIFPWEINGADNWNLGGLHHNADYGFGTIDAYGAVRLAETWTKTRKTSNELEVEADLGGRLPNGQFNLAGEYAIEFTAPENMVVEHVTLDVDMTAQDFFGQNDADNFIIKIVSPNGTISDVKAQETVIFGGDDIGYEASFTTRKFWGEEIQDGTGTWQVIFDTGSIFDDTDIRLFDVDLTFYGAGNTRNDTYIFTDEFDDLQGQGYGKRLRDTEGKNDVNAAAVSEDLKLVASAGETATAGSKTLYKTAQNTVLDDLYAGDGDDTLVGSAEANLLYGGRGADLLKGRAGKDELDGGRGRDELDGGKGADLLIGGAAADELTGGKGADVFVFGNSPGDDIILDFESNKDIIDFSENSDFNKFRNVEDAAKNRSGDLLIELSKGSIYIENFTKGELDASQFLF